MTSVRESRVSEASKEGTEEGTDPYRRAGEPHRPLLEDSPAMLGRRGAASSIPGNASTIGSHGFRDFAEMAIEKDPLQHRAPIHTDLDALLAVIGERRAAAARGDAVATVWIAGMNHWLRQYRAGAVATDLVITPDLVSELRYHGAVTDFEAGYRCAAAVQSAGAKPSSIG